MEVADLIDSGKNRSKDEGIKDAESENKGQEPCNLQPRLGNAIVKTEIKMEDDDDDDLDSASEKGSIDEEGDMTAEIEKNGQEPCDKQAVLDNEIVKSEIKMEDDDNSDSSTDNGTSDEEGSNFTVGTERNGQVPCHLEDVLDDTIEKSEIKMDDDDIIDCPTENSPKDKDGDWTAGIESNGQESCHLEDVLDDTSVKSEIKMEEYDIIDCPTENSSKDEEVKEGVQTETNEQNSGAREVQMENVIAKNNIRMEGYVLRDTVIQFGRALRLPLLLNETVPEHVGGKLNARTDEMPTESETTESSWTKLNNAIFKDGILIDNTNVIYSGLIQKSSQLNILNKNIKIVDTRKNGQETFECPETKMRNLVEKEITDDIFLFDSAFECPENKMRNLVEKEIITTDDIFLFDSAFECPENKMRNLVEKEIITTDDIFLFDSAFECPENKMCNLVEKEIITTDDIFLFDSAIQPGTNTNSETNENLSNKEKRPASLVVSETELKNTIPKAKVTMEDAHLQVSALRIRFNNTSGTYEVLRTVKNGREPFQDPEVESDHMFVRKKTAKVDNIGNNGQQPSQGPGIETDINIMMRCSVRLERLPSIEKYCQEPFEYPTGVLPNLDCLQSGSIQVQRNDMSNQMNGQGHTIGSEADKTAEENNDILFINLGVLNNKPEPVDAEMDGQDPLTCIEIYNDDILSSSETHDARPVESDNKRKAWSDEEVSTDEFQDLSDECIDVDQDLSDDDDQPLSVLTKQKNPLNNEGNKAGPGKQISTELEFQYILTENNGQNPSENRIQNKKVPVSNTEVLTDVKCQNLRDKCGNVNQQISVLNETNRNNRSMNKEMTDDSSARSDEVFNDTEIHQNLNKDKNVSESANYEKENNDFLFVNLGVLINKLLNKKIPDNKPDPEDAAVDGQDPLTCIEMYGDILSSSETHDARPVESDNKGKAWSDEEVTAEECQDLGDECIDADEDFSDEDDQPLSVLTKHNPLKYKIKNTTGSGKQVSTELESKPVNAEMDGQDPLLCINIFDDDILSSSDVEFVDSTEVQDNVVSTKKDLHDPNQKIEIAHKNYKCNLCDETFTLKFKYQEHLFYHTIRNMKCFKCHRMFGSGVALKNHMQYHNKKPPQRKKHLSIHMDKNIHNCSVCHKSFIDHKSLLNHKLIHQFTNSYKCIHCSKLYGTIVHLNKHLITHDTGPVESDNKGKAWSDKEVSTEEFQDLSDECINSDQAFSDEDEQPRAALAKHNLLKYKVKNKAGSGKQFQDILTENNGHNPSENRIQNKKEPVPNTDILTDVKCQNYRDKCGNVNQQISVLIETNRNNSSQNKEVTHDSSARSVEVFNDTEIHQDLDKDKNISESVNYEKENNDILFINIGVVINKMLNKIIPDNKPDPVDAEMDAQDSMTCIDIYEDDILSSDVEFVDSKKVQDKVISTEKDLHDRNQKIEIANKNYKCNLCDETFTLKSECQEHLLYHTIGNTNITCLKCRRMFDSGVALQNHMQTKHNKNPPQQIKQLSVYIDKIVHRCSVCDKSFIDRKSLLNHKLIHQFTNSYKCIHCNKSCRTLGHLNKHLLTHDARPVESDNKGKAWSDEEVSTEEFQDLSDECINGVQDFSDEDDQPLSLLAKQNPLKYKIKNKTGSEKQVLTELEPEPVDAEMDGQDPLMCVDIYEDDILSSSDVEFVDSKKVQDKVVATELEIKSYENTVHLNKHLITHDTRPVESDSKEKAWSDTEVSTEECEDLDCTDVDHDFRDEDDQLSVLTKQKNQLKYIVKNKTGSGKQVSTKLEPEPAYAEMDGQDPLMCVYIYEDDILLSSDVEFVDSKEVQDKVVSTELEIRSYGNIVHLNKHLISHDTRPVESDSKEKAWSDKEVSTEEFEDMDFADVDQDFRYEDDQLSVLTKQKNPLKYIVKNKSGSGKQVSNELEPEPVDADMDSQDPLMCVDIYEDDIMLSSDVEFVNSKEVQDKVISTELEIRSYENIVHLNKHLISHDTRTVESDSKEKEPSDKEVSTEVFEEMSDECIDVDQDFSDEDDQPLSVLTKQKNPLKYIVKNNTGSGKQVSKELESEPVDAEMNGQDPLTCIEIYDDDDILSSSDVEFVNSKEVQDKIVSTNVKFQNWSDKSKYVNQQIFKKNIYKLGQIKTNRRNRSKNKEVTDESSARSDEDVDPEYHQGLNVDKNVSESANHQQNYMCIGCGDMFTSTEELKKHEITHKKYECDLCENVFNQYSKYQQHRAYHINGDKLKCLHCKRSFDSGLTLKCHMQTRNCKKCRKCLLSSADLEQHMQFMHSGIHPYKCTKCDEGFLLAEELDKHSRIHSYKRVHTCPVCGKSFSKRYYLYKHFLTHSDKRDYKCTKCSKSFKSPNDLKSHLVFHSGVKNHMCLICSKAFVKPFQLKKHLNKHTGIQPHKCPLCDKRFSHIKWVKRHLVVIHYGKKEHKCIHCNECFALFPDLERHYATHNDPRPSKCKECPKSFVKKRHLITHMLSHSGVKPHQCVQCGSSFRLPHHLRNHLLTHSTKKRPKSK